MKGLIADPIDWVVKRQNNILKAITTKGFIQIEKIGKSIIAIDNYGNTIAETYLLSEKGLAWVKKECRGFHDWNRLNWKIVTKAEVKQ